MQVEFPLIFEEISAAFPPDGPLPQRLTDSYGDAVTETEPFRNLRWPEVPAHLLRRKFEAVFFFSPEALHYYFPAFIWCSSTHWNIVDLPVDNLLGCLARTENPSWANWWQDRWNRFTPNQWELVRKWLEWLQTIPDQVASKNLQNAYAAVRDGVWLGPK